MTVEQNTLQQKLSIDWSKRLTELEARVETTRAQSDQDLQSHLDALISLGQSYMETGNVPKALTQFEEGLALAEATADKSAEARFWGHKGIALIRLGNTQFAQRSLFRSLNLAKETEQTALIIDTLTQIGELHAATNQQTKAVARLEQAFGLATQAEEHTRRMLVAGQLGDIFLAMDATEKALEYYGAALETAQAVDNPRAGAAFQVSIGNVLLATGEEDIACEQFESALEVSDLHEDWVTQVRALNGLLRAQISAKKASLAILYGDRLVNLTREIGDAHAEIANLNLLITFLLQQEQMRKALPYLKRGLEIAQAQEDWAWQLSMLTNLGYVHHETENLAPALDAYSEARRWAEQLQDMRAVAQLEGRIGAVLADMGGPLEGVAAAERALHLAQDLEDPSLIGEQQILLAFLHYDLDNPVRALDFCRRAVETFKATGDTALTAKAQILLGELEAGS